MVSGRLVSEATSTPPEVCHASSRSILALGSGPVYALGRGADPRPAPGPRRLGRGHAAGWQCLSDAGGHGAGRDTGARPLGPRPAGAEGVLAGRRRAQWPQPRASDTRTLLRAAAGLGAESVAESRPGAGRG